MNPKLFCRQCGVPLIGATDSSGLCASCLRLREAPDGLSKRNSLAGAPFVDLKQMDEDQRVQLIVKHLKGHKVVSFIVDTGPEYQGKGDRMIEKIKAALPTARVKDRRPGPVAGAETINFTNP